VFIAGMTSLRPFATLVQPSCLSAPLQANQSSSIKFKIQAGNNFVEGSEKACEREQNVYITNQ
jgi:hypothetical protein